jgi:hypothetical protein
MSQTVNLVLKTTQISSDNTPATYFGNTVTTQYGSISNNRSSFKWNNINMKTLLGDMFDKYERFNICLNFIGGAATGSSAETNPDNRCFQIKLSGLPFLSSYNIPTIANTGIIHLQVVQVPLTIATTWVNNFFNSQMYTFAKQDLVNISIDLTTVVGDSIYTPATLNNMIGHCIFSFSVYGVTDFLNQDITSHRMDIHK